MRLNSTDNPSYLWKSPSSKRNLLTMVIRQKIYSGYNVKVWEDPWIATTPTGPARPIIQMFHPRMTVRGFINVDSKEWDVRVLVKFFHPEDIPLI